MACVNDQKKSFWDGRNTTQNTFCAFSEHQKQADSNCSVSSCSFLERRYILKLQHTEVWRNEYLVSFHHCFVIQTSKVRQICEGETEALLLTFGNSMLWKEVKIELTVKLSVPKLCPDDLYILIKIGEFKNAHLKGLQSLQQMVFYLCITIGSHLLRLTSIYSSAPKHFYYNLYI